MDTSTTLGAGLVAPERTTAAAPAGPTPGPRPALRRRLLAGAALLSPLALATQYALSSAGLPRDDAASWLAGIAEAPGREVLAIAVYLVGMLTVVAVAALVALAGSRRARALSATAAALVTAGAIGGAGFAGIRLVAVVLAESGDPAAVGVWTAVQDGAPFAVLGSLVAMAVLGTLVATAALVRARQDVTVWAAPAYLGGFVLSSGEFPAWVGVVGCLVQAAALVPVARAALRA